METKYAVVSVDSFEMAIEFGVQGPVLPVFNKVADAEAEARRRAARVGNSAQWLVVKMQAVSLFHIPAPQPVQVTL